ncbi:ArnT family glycosyltransferase [Streptantibioticus ferralitis]|uniref:Phospholipid carrier-dependent glycosyltransferase n=1 Tax=Streptantibioticus ferralitis TaxID=236510 RepID=A0ABT5YYW6_9ACTN|nr:phospholipid carrier-dependent glycosyltransferase [Streptantibioticus ferralitis]MDF2256792.1 phospholipid carrier-dependent glycosyltransferase [Streptantibioticus ferralitis]
MTATVPAAVPSAADPVRPSAAPVARFRRARPDLLVCAPLLAVILLVQGWNITAFPALSDDEGTYLSQAWAVQQGQGLAHYTYWYDHPPLGWIQLALVTWVPSAIAPPSMAVGSMRCVMLLVTAVSAVLLFVLARRLGLPRWAAALGMALFGLSPLSVVLQREIFLDNIAVMWMLLAFVLAASPSRHLWHHFGAGVAAATAVLSKETMLVVLPALLVTMWRHSHRDTRKFAVTGAVTACVLIGLCYPLYALLKGELWPGPGHVSLTDGILFQMRRTGSGSIFSAHSGAHAVLNSWLYYDRVLPLGGLAAVVLLLLTAYWSGTGRAVFGPVLAAALLAAVAMRPTGYLPAMYVIQALPFLALSLAGLAVAGTGLAERVARRVRRVAAARLLRWSAVGALGALTAAVVVPNWYDGDRSVETIDANAAYRSAALWMATKAGDPARTRVLVDDALWLDLVHQGYRPGTGVIWFYKADLDPAVSKTMPHGYRDIDYVVATPTVRRDAVNLPTVRAALDHSETVAAFGSGDNRIEIRRVPKEADGHPRVPQSPNSSRKDG